MAQLTWRNVQATNVNPAQSMAAVDEMFQRAIRTGIAGVNDFRTANEQAAENAFAQQVAQFGSQEELQRALQQDSNLGLNTNYLTADARNLANTRQEELQRQSRMNQLMEQTGLEIQDIQNLNKNAPELQEIQRLASSGQFDAANELAAQLQLTGRNLNVVRSGINSGFDQYSNRLNVEQTLRSRAERDQLNQIQAEFQSRLLTGADPTRALMDTVARMQQQNVPASVINSFMQNAGGMGGGVSSTGSSGSASGGAGLVDETTLEMSTPSDTRLVTNYARRIAQEPLSNPVVANYDALSRDTRNNNEILTELVSAGRIHENDVPEFARRIADIQARAMPNRPMTPAMAATILEQSYDNPDGFRASFDEDSINQLLEGYTSGQFLDNYELHEASLQNIQRFQEADRIAAGLRQRTNQMKQAQERGLRVDPREMEAVEAELRLAEGTLASLREILAGSPAKAGNSASTTNSENISSNNAESTTNLSEQRQRILDRVIENTLSNNNNLLYTMRNPFQYNPNEENINREIEERIRAVAQENPELLRNEADFALLANRLAREVRPR